MKIKQSKNKIVKFCYRIDLTPLMNKYHIAPTNLNKLKEATLHKTTVMK